MKLLFVILAVLGWTAGFAERIYVLFDPACGSTIEYERIADGITPGAYYAHTLSLGNDSTIILESDASGVRNISSLPLNYLPCGNIAALPTQLADRINRGEVQVVLLIGNQDEGYQEHPVLMASVMVVVDDIVSYRSPLIALSFDRLDVVIGKNLSADGSGSNSVQFEGREGLDCASPYLFHQRNTSGAYGGVDFKLYPGVGMLERTLTPADGNGVGATIRAVEVNGKPVAEFLLDRCRPGLNELAYSDQQRDFVPLYVEPAPRLSTAPGLVGSRAIPESMTPASPPEKDLPGGRTHTVRTGETLYGISRLHGISVGELMTLNGLGSNTIYIGQELAVSSSDPTEYPVQTTASVNVPESYAPPEKDPGMPIRNQSFYTVRAGETLAGIAFRSGYTTERFAEINGLDEGSMVYDGQELRTSHCDCATSSSRIIVPEVQVEAELPRPGDHIYYPPPPVIEPMRADDASPSPPAYGEEVSVYVQREQDGLPGESRQIHTVREGENLYAIARKYSITVAEIRELNGLMPTEVIVPYQKLYLN